MGWGGAIKSPIKILNTIRLGIIIRGKCEQQSNYRLRNGSLDCNGAVISAASRIFYLFARPGNDSEKVRLRTTNPKDAGTLPLNHLSVPVGRGMSMLIHLKRNTGSAVKLFFSTSSIILVGHQDTLLCLVGKPGEFPIAPLILACPFPFSAMLADKQLDRFQSSDRH